jgi:hypothetical protein
MDESHIANEFIRIIDKHVQNKLSKLTRDLIKKNIDEDVIIKHDFAKAISRISTAVKLFGDEKKAEDILKELKHLVGL